MAYDIAVVLSKSVAENVTQAKAESWTATQVDTAIRVKQIQLLEQIAGKL